MVLAAALALLAAACGDDDDGAAVPPDNESATGEDQPVSVEVDEAALQAILDQWRTDAGAFGATLSLRVPGHDDIHLASGIDDRDPQTPMPTDGTFGIGSVTKTFVAATALQLVEEGKLSLGEPVAAWLPELPHADQVTLAMLLGHTSGLGMRNEIEYVFSDLARAYTPEEALAEQLQAPPVGQPGERFSYANGGYIAVGLMIERVLDQDWRRSSRNGSPNRSHCPTPAWVTAPSRRACTPTTTRAPTTTTNRPPTRGSTSSTSPSAP